jgi:hypothetical protein
MNDFSDRNYFLAKKEREKALANKKKRKTNVSAAGP